MTHPLRERIGFIGAGNMANAIAGGLIGAELAMPSQMIASDPVEAARDRMARDLSIATTVSNAEVAAASDVIIIATKPYQTAEVSAEIRPAATPAKLFVSICAGVPTAAFEQWLGPGTRVVRVMPNTPALVGGGSTAVAGGANASDDDVEFVARLFRAVGIVAKVPEDQMDLVTGLTGSGPAYVYLLGEAMIDAGIELGMAPADAEAMVRQLLKGAGQLAADSEHPLATLRAMVTTKGGTTEAGLGVLEAGGFRKLVRDCVARATERSKELSGGK